MEQVNQLTLQNVADVVQSQTEITVTSKDIERILHAIQRNDNFWQICGDAHLPVPVITSAIQFLFNQKMIEIRDQKVFLTNLGKKWIQKWKIEAGKNYTCSKCQGRGIDLSSKPDWVTQFLQIEKDRPAPKQQFDQGSVTPETTIARVLLLDQRDDLRNKRILILGAEDDLTGLAIAMTNLAEEVLILDIDERFIQFDHYYIQKWGLKNATAMVFDLRNPFPEEWLHRFDVFITDPPETYSAFKAFIGRGIAALKGKGCVGYFGLTRQDASLKRWMDLQKLLLNEWGAVITDIIHDFNHYQPWDYHDQTRAANLSPVKSKPDQVWYRSSWYRIELLQDHGGTNEPISPEILDELYLDEESSTT